jgi:hypothetical protein
MSSSNSIKIKTIIGDYLPEIVEKAVQASHDYDYAHFDFNGVQIAVRTDS